MRLKHPVNRSDAETIALKALGFIAADSERISRFLSLSGVDPSDIRRAAQNPAFLAGILDYLRGDQSLLLEFSSGENMDPARIDAAAYVLSGTP
ncbi:DUF3572 domain-containing protein [Aestuariivirga sp.]|uniref:DUF3572 domain-containing protein n=1 Tax=Aestuariivirga sp. TaxID=2650926 RepID=UPI0039E5CED9